MLKQQSLVDVSLLHRTVRIWLARACEGWHEYEIGVCVDTESMVKLGALTFRAESLSGAESLANAFLALHPILTLNLFDATIQPVEGDAESFFIPIEHLCKQH